MKEITNIEKFLGLNIGGIYSSILSKAVTIIGLMRTGNMSYVSVQRSDGEVLSIEYPIFISFYKEIR